MPPTTLAAEDETALLDAEHRIFDAIRQRDIAVLEAELSPEFRHASIGGDEQLLDAFLMAVRESPFEILELRGRGLRCRAAGNTAIVSGVQEARVKLPDGTEASGATAFVDVFVRTPSGWRLWQALSQELPEAP
jgi:hypothetical protein